MACRDQVQSFCWVLLDTLLPALAGVLGWLILWAQVRRYQSRLSLAQEPSAYTSLLIRTLGQTNYSCMPGQARTASSRCRN